MRNYKNIIKLHKKIIKLFPDCIIKKANKEHGIYQSLTFKSGQKDLKLIGDHTITININSLVNGNIVEKDAYNRYRVLHCSLKPRLIYKIIKDMRKIDNEQ